MVEEYIFFMGRPALGDSYIYSIRYSISILPPTPPTAYQHHMALTLASNVLKCAFIILQELFLLNIAYSKIQFLPHNGQTVPSVNNCHSFWE
jgi:hypothetical protein